MSTFTLSRTIILLCTLLLSSHSFVRALTPLSQTQYRLQLQAQLGLQAHQKVAQPPRTCSGGPIKPEFVELPLDHFGDNSSTFRNRYWVSETYYRPGGPVLFYDVGEVDASDTGVQILQNSKSFFKTFLQEFGALGIAWEHRFYGQSTPVPISLSTPSEQFRYLTIQQALADIPAFAKNFSRPNLRNATLTPKSTPWVFIGGSYPGARAALVRNLYPDTIYASYASSAAINATVNFPEYFEQVYRGLVAYGYGNCTKDIHSAIDYIDSQLGDPQKAASLKLAFLGQGADRGTNGGFADALTSTFTSWQAYGAGGGPMGVGGFCDWIARDPSTNKTSGADGWASTKGVNFTLERWAKWPYFTTLVNMNLEANCAGQGPANSTTACNLDPRLSDPASISWSWQYCTQWGFFQTANTGDNQIISSSNDVAHQAAVCHRQFPDGKASGLLPDLPNAEQTNKDLGGWTIRPSNVYWSGGQYDPWRELSPLSSDNTSKHYMSTQDIPTCNTKTNADTVFGYTMPNAEHCFDFQTNFAAGSVSRNYFKSALQEWLKCFNKS